MDIGVLFNTDRLDGRELIAYAQRLDESGIESLWLPELFTREPFAAAGFLLASTSRIRLATGIANIYARDAVATVSAASALAELSEGRFILGLGVSNASLNAARGHRWEPPTGRLREYLEAMHEVRLTCPRSEFPVHVAAHGPRMLGVAAQLSDGANTYLMPVAHVSQAREVLGDAAALNTMLMCLDETDPVLARSAARKALTYYVPLDYYQRAWRAFGFDDTDFADGGSDRLIDAIVAWGDIESIRARIAAQMAAGASRVVVIPLGINLAGAPNWHLLEQLAT